MSTTSSTAPAPDIDYGHAFGYVFRSPNWFGRIAIGALCVLFFWVLLIPIFILYGYFIETARTIKAGGRELPPWVDIGKKLREGFVLFVALFIWGLPGSILNGGGSFSCSGSPQVCAYHPGSLAGLGGLYGLLLSFITAAIWSQYLDGGFNGAFDFRAIFRRALLRPGMTVLVFLFGWLAVIIGFAGLIIVLVGFLFTLPYAFAVLANLYGQFGRVTETAAMQAAPG